MVASSYDRNSTPEFWLSHVYSCHYLAQDCVQRVQVDVDVGTFARRLLRKFPIRKPQDAIHAATAALNNIDELHTFDGSDLLPLDGQVSMSNGEKLRICKPPTPPDPDKGTLFEVLKLSPLDQEDGHDQEASSN
jgi:hypothetical protein